jgi:hypothetical protein
VCRKSLRSAVKVVEALPSPRVSCASGRISVLFRSIAMGKCQNLVSSIRPSYADSEATERNHGSAPETLALSELAMRSCEISLTGSPYHLSPLPRRRVRCLAKIDRAPIPIMPELHSQRARQPQTLRPFRRRKSFNARRSNGSLRASSRLASISPARLRQPEARARQPIGKKLHGIRPHNSGGRRGRSTAVAAHRPVPGPRPLTVEPARTHSSLP